MLENIETEADIFCKEHSLNNDEKKWIDLFVNKLKKQIIQQKNSGSEDNNAEHTYLGRGVKIYKEEIEDIY